MDKRTAFLIAQNRLGSWTDKTKRLPVKQGRVIAKAVYESDQSVLGRWEPERWGIQSDEIIDALNSIEPLSARRAFARRLRNVLIAIHYAMFPFVTPRELYALRLKPAFFEKRKIQIRGQPMRSAVRIPAGLAALNAQRKQAAAERRAAAPPKRPRGRPRKAT